MNDISPQNESMIYASQKPDVKALTDAYEGCLTDLDEYFDLCLRSYNDRRNLWPGKTDDLRKGGANAFPWQGASDIEVNVVGERTDSFVAILDQALMRANIKAFPTSISSMPRASVVSAFLKWMRSSYIPNFRQEMELGANYLLEKGLMITYVGWRKEKRTMKQTVTLEQIASIPELADLAEAIAFSPNDPQVMTDFGLAFPGTSEKRLKKAIKELSVQGVTEIPFSKVSVDCPTVQACSPDADVFFPAYCKDPNRAPYVFFRDFLTAQELEEKVENEGWDADWVAKAIAERRGQDTVFYDGQKTKRVTRLPVADDEDLVMVLYAYQRLVDKTDGSEGIYCTVFHPEVGDYAKHELLNGYDTYPFVLTRLSNNQKRMYETQTFSDILRGAQMQIKTERDSRIDRASYATMPPLMHPAGKVDLTDFGPGRRIPYRRLGEIQFAPIPQFDPGSIEVENSMVQQANRAVGLDLESPIAMVRQQFLINKYLDHVRDVLAMAFKLFQRMGPDSVWFQVTGNPNPQVMDKGNPDDNFTISVAFDAQSSDPETAEAQMKQMVSLLQFDRNGKMDVDKMLEFMATSISPSFADYVLMPAEEAQEKVANQITNDIAKIYSGIEMAPPPNGAQMAMQMIQSYTQQPDIAQRLQQDEAFQGRLQKYAEQIQFQLQQMQNAQIGKIGGMPAQMGGIQTQNLPK
jgi:hypothetical protein